MSQRVQVPAQQAVAIHYPGYVQDADAALDTMGGIRRISDAHFPGSANFVQVKCRPGDELAHPIFGERQPCNALLLRLTQPNARDSSVDAGSGTEQLTVKAEIVARVATGYRFTGMADFQYTDAPSNDLGEFAEVDGPFGPECSPMTVLPPLFSKQDEPLDYSFKRQPPLPAPSQPRKQAQQPAALQPPMQPTAALPQKPQQHAQQPAAQPTSSQQQPQQHGSLQQHQKPVVSLLVIASAILAAAYRSLAAQHARALAEAAALRAELCDRGGAVVEACLTIPAASPAPRTDVLQLASRVASAMLLLWMAACAFLAWRYLDSLPALANRLAPGRVAGIAELSHTHSLRKQLAYHVDVWFSRSPYSKVLALLYLTLALVFIGALGLKSVTQQSFYSAVWETIAGVGIDWTFASLDDSSGSTWGGFLARSVAVLVSLGGLCITALMLGIVSEQISHVIEELKKGKSEVLESGHTLILGWSDKVATIVDQLCLANESEGGGPIVILADMPKEDMEEELRNHSIQFLGSHVVCRSGNPHLEMDLRRVSVITARATVVLSTCEVADQADARVLRTVLSLTGEHDRLVKAGGPGLRGHIVAELADIDNEPLVSMCGQQSRVFTVTSHDIIGRLMVQCARQPGLAAVWETLMGFRGDEFYLQAWPSLTGRRFAEVLLMFEYALPLGVKPAATGEVMMNPGDDYVFAEGDELLVLAEDDDTYSPAAKPALAQPGTCPAWANSSKPERILLVGWRRDLDDLIMAVDEFVTPGSEVHLYNDVAVEEREKMLLHGGLNVDSLQNLTLVYKERMMQGEVVDRKRLEDLRPEQYTSILILSDADNLGTVDSDSRCIAVALLLRDIQSSRLAELAMDDRRDSTGMPAAEPQVLRSVSSLGRLRNAIGGVSFTSARGSSGSISSVRSGAAGGSKRVQPSASMLRRLRQAKHQTVIIAEILDARAKRIVSELGICEFIMSSDIVSMALAMCAENPAVIAVLAELFTEAGNELYVHPVERYLHPEEVLTFYDIILRGRQKQHIILGYSERGTSRIVLNPKNKGSRFYSHDTVEAFVVLAESP